MIGDFNLNKPEEEGEISPDFQDVWKLVKPTDPGFTFDPTINFTDEPGAVSRQRRYDRIYVRSLAECWKYDSIDMIGKESFEFTSGAETVKLFPSDHFGLICHISFSQETKEQKSNTNTAQEIKQIDNAKPSEVPIPTPQNSDSENLYSSKLEDYLRSANTLETEEGMKKREKAIQVLDNSLKGFFKEVWHVWLSHRKFNVMV